MWRKLTLVLTIITLTVAFGQNDFSLGQDAAGCFRIDDDAALDVTGDFTIEAWVYINDDVASGRFIADRAGEWELFIFSSSVRFDLNGGTVISTGVLSQNEWHHVAVVRAGSRTLIFADGAKIDGADLALTDGTTPVVIGGQDSWFSATPNSIFDEVKFSNIALYDTTGFSPSTTAPLGTDANTVFYFQFEDNTELPPLDDGPLTLSTSNGQTDGTEPVTADNYVAAPAGLPLSLPGIVINEFDTNTSSLEYLELFNTTSSDIDLAASGLVLVFVNGYNDEAYQATELTGTLPADGFFVLAESGVTEVEGYTPDQNGTWTSFQNGTDGAALVFGAAAADFPGDALYSVELAAATGAAQVDAIIYDDADGDTGLETEFGLPGILIINGSSGSSSRVTDGQGGAAYANSDWHITATRTPGATNVAAPPTYNPYTIVEIQTPDTGGDASQHADEYVETSGVITALTSYSFYMQDGTADYSGIYVYVSGDVSAYALGDNVTVQGVVIEYNNLTQISSIADITINSSGNDLPAPIVLVTNTLAEEHEGMLVTVSGECTAVSTNAGSDHWAFKLDDGSGDALVDDQVFSAAETATTVGSYYDVVGAVNYYYGAFTVNPRDADDIVEIPVDLNEPNDDLATATAIAGNDTLAGIVDPADDVDFFTFTLTEESDVIIDLFIDGYSELDGEVALFSSDSTGLDSDDSGLSGDDEQITTTLVAGTYYIGAADWSDLRASTGAYALGFFAEPAAGAPQGSVCADPIALTLPAVDLAGTTEGFGDDYGTSPCNSNYMGGDDIVYEFTLTEAGYLSGSVAGSYAGLHILDDCPDASPTCIAYATGSSGGSFSYAPIAAGTYFTIVSTWPSPQSITFTLDLSFDTSLPQGFACDNPFDYGVVNSVEATGAIASYEAVWYSFTVDDAYESILVSLCGSEFDTKLEVWLACDSSSYEYYNDDNYTLCSTGSRSAIEITGDPALALGTYYVKVYGYSSSSGNYTLDITGETELLAADFVVTSMTMSTDTLDVVVTNQGNADSPGWNGTDYHGLYINGVYQGYVVESGVALAIGASHTYTLTGFNYYTLGDTGDYEIVFECDTDDDVLELDETNNLDTLNIHIDPPPPAPVNFMADAGAGYVDLSWETSASEFLPPAPVAHNGLVLPQTERKIKADEPEGTAEKRDLVLQKKLSTATSVTDISSRDLTGSSVTVTAIDMPTGGTDLVFDIDIVSSTISYCDGLQLTFPAGVVITAASGSDEGDGVINGQVVTWGANDTTGWGGFSGGEAVTVFVEDYTTAFDVDFLLWDDGYADPVVDATGTVSVPLATLPEPGELCETAIDYGAVNDPAVLDSIDAYGAVWYSFTYDGSFLSVTVSLCESDFDTKLEVWAACDDAEYLGYNDDNTSTCGSFGPSVIEFAGEDALTAGTYYVKCYGYSSNYGDVVLEVTGSNDAPDLTVTEFWSSADTVFAEVSNIGTDVAGSQSAHWFVNGVDVGYLYPAALAPGESDTVGLYGLTYANFGPDTLEVGLEVDFYDNEFESNEDNNFVSTEFIVTVPDYIPTYNVYREEVTREFVLIAADLDADDWAFNGYYRDADVVSGTEYCYYATQILPDASESVPSNEDCATADPGGAVEGIAVNMAGGLPVPGVWVEVITIDGEFLAEDSTDAEGYYLIEYLPLGFNEIGFYADGFHAVGFGINIVDGDTAEQNVALVADSMTQVPLYYTGYEAGDDQGAVFTWTGNNFAIVDTFFAPTDTVLPATGAQMLAFPEQDSLTYANDDAAYWLGSGAGQIDVTGYETGSILLQVDALFDTENGWDFFYLAVMLDDGEIWVDTETQMSGYSDGWVTVTADFSWVMEATTWFYPMILFESDGSIVDGWGGAFDNFKVFYDSFFNAPVADLAVTHYADATLTWAAPASRGTVEYEVQRVDPDNTVEYDADEGVVTPAKRSLSRETVTMTYEYSNSPSRSLVGYKVYRQDNPFPLEGPVFLDVTTDLTYTDATAVDGNYYDFAVTALYDEGESHETIVQTHVGAVTQVLPGLTDFEGLTAIPAGWEAFTSHPDGITWTVGDSADADSSFYVIGKCPAHTDFAFIEDGTGNGYTFEALLLSPFIDASDMHSSIVSFAGYEQGWGTTPDNTTMTELLVRVDMGDWHTVTDFSYDHNDGWVDYMADLADLAGGEEYVQFAFYYFHLGGYSSANGEGMGVDDFDFFGLAGPTNLVAAGTQGQIELSWDGPAARSRELIRGTPVTQQITMDRNESDLVPGPVYDNRDACYSNWLPSGWFTGFYGPHYYGPDSGFAAPTLATLFEFPPGPMTLEMAVHHGIWYNAADPFPDTVRAFVTVASTDLAGVTQSVIESDTVFYALESSYYYDASLDLVGLEYQQTDSSYLKVAVELLDDAYYSNFDANIWMPPLRIDAPTPDQDDINSGLSGYDSSGFFQQDSTYDWFLEICGTPTPPALRFNVYRDDILLNDEPLEEETYIDEDVIALEDYDYFVTGYVPLILASDNPGAMIFVDTDSSNHSVAAGLNTPPPAPSLVMYPDNFTLSVDNLTGATGFIWQPSVDPDIGQTVTYDFVFTLGTYTWEISTDVTTVAIPYLELYTEIFDVQGAASLTGTWNVTATDGYDDTPAVNGPRTLTVDLTAVGVEVGPEIPDVFALHQNYPNPFNPITTINYDIPELSQVRIDIYNLLGQKVRTLINGEHAPAYYQVRWDGTTDAGATVASGLYIYRIEANEFSAIRKLVIMK